MIDDLMIDWANLLAACTLTTANDNGGNNAIPDITEPSGWLHINVEYAYD